MAGNRPHVFNVGSAGTSPGAANTEAVAQTLPGVTNEFSSQQVALRGWVEYTPGAGATAVTLRVRRDSLTGTLVGTADVQSGDIVAAKLTALGIECTDQRGGDFAGSYVLTVQGTGEGGAGTTGQASLTATVS